MHRRVFLRACALAGTQFSTQTRALAGDQPMRAYARVLLVDARGEPVRPGALVARRNYIFHYPYAGTPCFLLNLGKALPAVADLQQEDGAHYGVVGGVGPQGSVVAYSAICAHQLAYPTPEITFIRFQSSASPRSDADRIHCCAEHSVYDPARGARVVSGPARQPLAAIVLEYDRGRDQLHALGTAGGELFDAFFAKYDFKLAMQYGSGGARAAVSGRAVVREMTDFCRQTIEC